MRARGTTKGVLRGIVGHDAATLRSEKGSDDRIWGWGGNKAFLSVRGVEVDVRRSAGGVGRGGHVPRTLRRMTADRGKRGLGSDRGSGCAIRAEAGDEGREGADRLCRVGEGRRAGGRAGTTERVTGEARVHVGRVGAAKT